MPARTARRRPPPRPVVAFIGLGRMGAPMAINVAAAGYAARGFDPAPRGVRALRRTRNMTLHASAREAAQGAGVVVTMLPDARVVRAVLGGRSGALAAMAPRTVVIDMSSADPADTARLARAGAARGIALVDAPVSGRADWAKAGTLSITTANKLRQHVLYGRFAWGSGSASTRRTSRSPRASPGAPAPRARCSRPTRGCGVRPPARAARTPITPASTAMEALNKCSELT